MKTIFAVLCWTIGFNAFAAPVPAEESEGSCVACHRNVRQHISLEHNFSDWENSIHGKSGVECQACHGGDSSQAAKTAAHAGLISSKDRASPVYFTRIPATCGACHASEFKAFQKSAHYKELESSGRGPNCVTCHGSMADHVIAPKDMEMTCTLCHRQPTQAYQARLAVEDARKNLRKLDHAIREAKSAGGIDSSVPEKSYSRLVDRLRDAMVYWHTFNMNKVLAQVMEISRDASAAHTELRLKSRKL